MDNIMFLSSRHRSFPVFSVLSCCWLLMICLCLVPLSDGHSGSRLPLAGIFGFNNNNNNNINNQGPSPPAPPLADSRPPPRGVPPVPGTSQDSSTQHAVPPRPPPSPPRHDKLSDTESTSTQNNERPPPPPPSNWGMGSATTESWGVPGQLGPPQPAITSTPIPFTPEQYQDIMMEREKEWVWQLENLTEALLVLEQREELQIRQLGVLTQRVIQAETQAAAERNHLLEYQANCTELGRTIATLQDELGQWQQRCSELTSHSEMEQEKLLTLQRMLKEKEFEAEELAVAIENLRILNQGRDAGLIRRKGGWRGMFSWVSFLFGSSSGDTFDKMKSEDAFGIARSTLLQALQSERRTVSDLEVAVSSLQQNNSAISEMVESRDGVIDELNDRISVFEEDKMVLKAALRQLQEDIKAEAPRTQKLMDDLEDAQEETEFVKREMTSMMETHQQEILALQGSLSSKQQTISETESNLTAIGSYVDKLEERLTSFAIARRDIEEREKKCLAAEEAAASVEKSRLELQRVAEEKSEKCKELQQLLDSLGDEKTELQKVNRVLQTEKEFRTREHDHLLEKCEGLENKTILLADELTGWKSKCEDLAMELQTVQGSNEELNARLENASAQTKELERWQKEARNAQVKLSDQAARLTSMEDENARLREHVRTLSIGSRQGDTKQPDKNTVPKRKRSIEKSREVPFRSLRKRLSRTTGIHGLLTPSSKKSRDMAGGVAPSRTTSRK